ncbi:unnamed protein product [Microthlaspi erraticum]|uniref:Reverse transcriptase zinc-binding domain-containing protein n=1 Tax=Microthlaspi erraticum TaxID=1685480 RepID=A0A6D2LQ65_9BRAS|nr:unnamed protein product [Microthlaspi erraticum]
MSSVKQACQGVSWSITRGRHSILRLLKDCLPPELPATLNGDHDIVLWRNSQDSPPGVFSASALWDSHHPTPPSLSWTKSVWFKDRIPKHAFILSIVMRDRLLTRDRLRSWGIAVPDNCLLCDVSPETRSHLLTDCAFTTEIWRSFFAHLVFRMPHSIDDIVLWCHSSMGNGKVNSICLLLVQTIVYCLWRERNARLHASADKPVHVLIKEINLLLTEKLFVMDRSTALRAPSVNSTAASQQNSYLYTWFQFFQH